MTEPATDVKSESKRPLFTLRLEAGAMQKFQNFCINYTGKQIDVLVPPNINEPKTVDADKVVFDMKQHSITLPTEPPCTLFRPGGYVPRELVDAILQPMRSANEDLEKLWTQYLSGGGSMAKKCGKKI